MFTGIVQGIASVRSLQDQPGLRSFTLAFPPGFDAGLAVGASVAVDGVCLTVTTLREGAADFDVMQQSLNLTTLGELREGSRINVERAARDGAEIGGHPLSGHIDVQARVHRITDEPAAAHFVPASHRSVRAQTAPSTNTSCCRLMQSPRASH